MGITHVVDAVGSKLSSIISSRWTEKMKSMQSDNDRCLAILISCQEWVVRLQMKGWEQQERRVAE